MAHFSQIAKQTANQTIKKMLVISVAAAFILMAESTLAHEVVDVSPGQQITEITNDIANDVLKEAIREKIVDKSTTTISISDDFHTATHQKHPNRYLTDLKPSQYYTMVYHPPAECDVYIDALEMGGVYHKLNNLENFSWTLSGVLAISIKHELSHCVNPDELRKKDDVAREIVAASAAFFKWDENTQAEKKELLVKLWSENPKIFTNMIETFADVHAFTWHAKTNPEKQWAAQFEDWKTFRDNTTKNKLDTHTTSKGLSTLGQNSHQDLQDLSTQERVAISQRIAHSQSLKYILSTEEKTTLETTSHNAGRVRLPGL